MLGTQLAAARAVEEATRATHPDLPSPIGVQYDFWHGEMDLARLAPSPVDTRVRALVQEFLDAADDERSEMRTALTMDDLYTVLLFSRRSTVASLQASSLEPALDALHAVALIDLDRVDWRDVPGPLELAAYAVKAAGGDLPAELAALRTIAVDKAGPMIARLENPSVEPTVQSAGCAQVNTRHGVGLIDCWSGGAESAHLGPLLVALADALDTFEYRTSSVTLSDGLPPVWFPKSARERVEQLADTARGGGSVSGRRRPGPDADAQQFSVFVLDTGSSDAALELVELADGSDAPAHAGLPLAHDTIFVLVVARSWVKDTRGIETSASLERFRQPFARALQEADL